MKREDSDGEDEAHTTMMPERSCMTREEQMTEKTTMGTEMTTLDQSCSSRRYGAPAPNRVRNGVRTCPHTPFEDRRVRSVSATRPGRSHALPRARRRTHAPTRAREEAAHAAKRKDRRPRARTRAHAPREGPHAQPRADTRRGEALVSEGSRERDRGQGRGHHRGTGKGRWRSQARGRTVRCFYCHQEGHIKRDCPKYKAQDQSSDTAMTTVMAVDESDILIAASDNGKSDWGELLSNMGPVVLARRMDKGSNRCTEVRKASAGVLGGSVMVPGGSEVVQERMEMLLNMYGSLARHEWCNQCRMSIEKLRERRSRRKDGATTTRKVTYFAAHPSRGCEVPQWGGAGHLGEKVQALRCGGAYTSVGSEVAR
ncbi:hypothetical protein Acr_04g0009320 [Actinidia rufa]|uniref:CCHC-type domain-containing protein n=1 Tax=Actinidia rufa TaxID=165716 RepID=A0A7J0EI88_9ERIC|nr:hypothetical protein Acr_04g0009320 [Actinidia rufa]